MIVGNKMDLCFESKSSNRMIDQIVLDIGKLADNLEVNQFLISAKTMDGIERLFQTVTSMILKDYSRKQYRSVHMVSIESMLLRMILMKRVGFYFRTMIFQHFILQRTKLPVV
ncbi:hypothetical protein QR98_0051140 [Sarcoptes scabiei]|uniref:Uncharacterized protein n=1 Tax=Sarcoptes scabiei TaxID=52283 RepID=A0A132A6S9_SARSC|nr:hypothetical protein QR98_0051140 [Sarcoptes scabiei]